MDPLEALTAQFLSRDDVGSERSYHELARMIQAAEAGEITHSKSRQKPKRSMVANPGVNLYNRELQRMRARQTRLHHAKVNMSADDLTECTFQPKINQKSKELAERKRQEHEQTSRAATPPRNVPRFDPNGSVSGPYAARFASEANTADSSPSASMRSAAASTSVPVFSDRAAQPPAPASTPPPSVRNVRRWDEQFAESKQPDMHPATRQVEASPSPVQQPQAQKHGRAPLGVKGPGKSPQSVQSTSSYTQAFVHTRASKQERQLERELGLAPPGTAGSSVLSAPEEDLLLFLQAPLPASNPKPEPMSPQRPHSPSSAATGRQPQGPQRGSTPPQKPPSSRSTAHSSPLARPADPPSAPASIASSQAVPPSSGSEAGQVLSALQQELQAVRELRAELQAIKAEPGSIRAPSNTASRQSTHSSAADDAASSGAHGSAASAHILQLQDTVVQLQAELQAGQEAVAAAKAERDGYLAERAGWLAQLRAENEQLQALYAQTSTAKANMRADLAALNAAHESLEEERVAVRQREDMMLLFIQGRGLGPAYAAFLQDRASGSDGRPLALPAPAPVTPSRGPNFSGIFSSQAGPQTVSPPGQPVVRRGEMAGAAGVGAAAPLHSKGGIAQLHALASRPL